MQKLRTRAGTAAQTTPEDVPAMINCDYYHFGKQFKHIYDSVRMWKRCLRTKRSSQCGRFRRSLYFTGEFPFCFRMELRPTLSLVIGPYVHASQ